MNDDSRNWPDDFAHENGNYQVRCVSCGGIFLGHKRRTTCRVCANIVPPNVVGRTTGFDLPEGKPERYLCATTECRVCGWQEVSVYPESCLVEDNQECGRCGAMSAEPIKYHGPVKDREHKHNTGDRLIVCAALRRGDMTIYGPRHGGPEIYAMLERLGLTHDDFELGFVDNHWKFVSRREAWTIALAAGQVRYRCGGDTAEGGTLYSENLY